MDPLLQPLAAAIRSARHVVVLTGAGVSAESGIPTFRSSHATMAGLWKDFDPATLATPEAFVADPETVTRWYDWRRLGCLAALPNPGHLALAQLERWLNSRSPAARFTLLTQNVDRLHHKAGSSAVIELHGNIITWRCASSGRKFLPGPEPFPHFPPKSPDGSILRPDVVWFGENLPPDAVAAAEDAALSCDLFLSIGTSSVVYPAAGFIQAASRSGAHTAEINPEATAISRAVDWSIRGKSGEVLPALMQLVTSKP